MVAFTDSPKDQFDATRIWVEEVDPKSAVKANAPYRHDKIRLAYVSADFHDHATAMLTARLFELHDRTRFEIVGISFSPNDQSAMRIRLMASFDRFIEVGDKTDREVADMMFAAATDHRYLDGGHTLDFTNKAFEALDHAGWDLAEPVLASLARGYATGDRMEEANSWRNPIDLIAILEPAFETIPDALAAGRSAKLRWSDGDMLVQTILGDDPKAIVDAMLLFANQARECEDDRAANIAFQCLRFESHQQRSANQAGRDRVDVGFDVNGTELTHRHP